MKHQSVSLREANQNFSRLIAAVERGEAFSITRRGQEVARLLPSSPVIQSDIPVKSGTSGKVLHEAPIPAQDTTLGERLLRLEARVDKLSSALPAATPPIINKLSPTC
jgi:prevent-host-death family protein